MNLIGINIYNPRNALFGNKNKDKERVTRYYCDQVNCPLLALGKCLNAGMFTRCKYGEAIVETGYTQRARKFGELQRKAKAERNLKGIGRITGAGNDEPMMQIGEYVYLPYPHIRVQEGKLDPRMSLFGSSGIFLPIDKFTPEFVLNLVKYRPRAVMGGVIRSFESEVVPKIIEDCATNFPEVWDAVVRQSPNLANMLKLRADALESEFSLNQFPYNGIFRCVWNGRKGKLFTKYKHFDFEESYDGKPAKISVTVDDSDRFKLLNRDDLAKIRRLVS